MPESPEPASVWYQLSWALVGGVPPHFENCCPSSLSILSWKHAARFYRRALSQIGVATALIQPEQRKFWGLSTSDFSAQKQGPVQIRKARSSKYLNPIKTPIPIMTTQRSPVGWFEIYVQDMDRAKAFYQNTFQVKLERLESPGLELWAFPPLGQPNNPGCSGAL